MRNALWVVAVGFVGLTACSGDDGTSDGPTASRSAPSLATPTSSETTVTPASTSRRSESSIFTTAEPSTTSDDTVADDVLSPASAVGLTVFQALQMSGDVAVDQSCFDSAVASEAAVDDADLAALDGQGGTGWAGVDPAAREGLLRAYLDCRDDLDLPMNVYLGMFHGPLLDDINCVLTPWREVLTTDLVASSLAVTSGLDDVPPSVTAELTSAMTACHDDAAWWIDDVAIRLEDTTDLSATEADCVAEAIVTLKGVAFVIDRRLATVPVWVMSPSDTAALDLSGQCGVTSLEQPRAPLAASRGACVNVAQNNFGKAVVVPCDGSHSGEVLGVSQWVMLRRPGRAIEASSLKDRSAAATSASSHPCLREATGTGRGRAEPQRLGSRGS